MKQTSCIFQNLCGTEPFPELYRAKKYKLNDHFFTKQDFREIMLNLPVKVISKLSRYPSFQISKYSLLLQVSDEDIEDMFSYADKDGDGKINWTEFQVMINPPKPPEPEKPSLADLAETIKSEKPQTLSVKKVLSGNISGNILGASWNSGVGGPSS